LRIISGKHKGKQIVAPHNLPVRPTTDIAKESLFNVLNNMVDFEELEVLDLFSGTGNISYEFYSRGAKSIHAIDSNHACVKFIDQTFKNLKAPNVQLFRTDVFIALPRFHKSFDLIFADPPYDFAETDRLVEEIFKLNLLNHDGIFVLEHPKEKDFSKHQHFTEKRQYGKVNFSFFTLQSEI
jgi:16S rRNA (guanine(966)-N(2))-methyltransferase RsmD